jgi:uncharacterized protein YneF (UPF0154 family)
MKIYIIIAVVIAFFIGYLVAKKKCECSETTFPR